MYTYSRSLITVFSFYGISVFCMNDDLETQNRIREETYKATIGGTYYDFSNTKVSEFEFAVQALQHSTDVYDLSQSFRTIALLINDSEIAQSPAYKQFCDLNLHQKTRLCYKNRDKFPLFIPKNAQDAQYRKQSSYSSPFGNQPGATYYYWDKIVSVISEHNQTCLNTEKKSDTVFLPQHPDYYTHLAHRSKLKSTIFENDADMHETVICALFRLKSTASAYEYFNAFRVIAMAIDNIKNGDVYGNVYDEVQNTNIIEQMKICNNNLHQRPSSLPLNAQQAQYHSQAYEQYYHWDTIQDALAAHNKAWRQEWKQQIYAKE